MPSKLRVQSIDILRGIIMIIMALDHTRDFFHITAMTADPTDPSTTTPALFFTRWITHYCAPLFVFLSGASAYLSGQRKTKKELSAFLFKRGLWLVILEIVIFNLFFSFDITYNTIALQVIWVTGISMMLLSILIYIPIRILFIIGVIVIAGHNVLDAFNYKTMREIPVWWGFLHQQDFVPLSQNHNVFFFYPLLPWPAVMMVGYCMGSWFVSSFDAAKRRKYLRNTGILLVIAFLLIRFSNLYGDLNIWTTQKNNVATVLSFFNVTKYPPSLLYLCMTIGPGLIMLSWLENVKAKWANIALIYGRVPMFYYFLHFFMLHLLCMIVFLASGHTFVEGTKTGMMNFRPQEFGYPLWGVYLIWIAVVAALYPLCKWYNNYKSTHDHWWLSYL